ncbi:MAG: ATP-binding cassette domain-containing protein [Hyphomicrobiales bacterium]
MPYLDLSHLEKLFGATRVVNDFNLGINKGEFVSLLGPSGCGKTTVLRMVAGFEEPTGGAIHIDGQDITRLPANRRNIGMVFQAYALFPNLTVAQNIGFGLMVAGVPRGDIDARVAEMLRLISLPDLGNRYPFQLSGGQQQRVALARALAPRPRVLLLDEPLSALDAKIRVSLRSEIREIQRELKITTIFVTHDQEEALSISDRIVVMNGGIAEQVGTPFEIYNRPATRFVANFVGTLNLFSAEVESGDHGRVWISGMPLKLGHAIDARKGERVWLAARPESLHLGKVQGSDFVLPVTIEEVHFLGSVIRLKVSTAEAKFSLDIFNRTDTPPPAVGTRADVSLSSRDLIKISD